MPAKSSNIQSAGAHQYDQTPPDGWRQVSLDSVAAIYFSGVDKKSRQGERHVFLCNYMDVYNKEYVYGYENFMPATATDSEIARLSIKPGDVIITKDSETPDDIGIPAWVMAAPNNLVCGYHLALIRPRQNQVNSLFLAKQLAHHRISRYFGTLANGMTRYGLATTVIESAPLWLPPIEAQRLISKALYTLDEAIQKTEQLIAKLKAIKQGLLHDLLTRGLDENGQLRDPVAHPEQFMDSPLGRIPKEWAIKEIGELASLEYGAGLTENKRSGIGYPVYGSNGIVGFHDTFLIQGPGIIVGRKGSVGSVHWSSNSFWPIDTAYYMNTKEEIDLRWFYWALQYSGLGKLDSSTGVPGLNRNDAYKLKLNEPTYPEQRQIALILDTFDETIQKTDDHLSKLKLLKKGLMNDLLTGKVRVNIKEGNRDQVKGESLYDQNPAERRLS
jgi:type I restriction enzyme S subunit